MAFVSPNLIYGSPGGLNKWIALSFGSQSYGHYELIYSNNVVFNRGILTITEIATGVSIGSDDAFCPVESTMDFSHTFYFAPSVSPSNLSIKWEVTAKNSNSTGYEIALANHVSLKQIG